jgi:hypothetical protein
MDEEPKQSNEPNRKGSGKVILGLFLAFVPSMICLSLNNAPILGSRSGNMFWLACGVSVVCCFASAALLCRQKFAWALIIGLMFFCLNAVISFALGCGAILSG